MAALLVCTDLALVLQRIGHAEWAVLRGNDRLGTAGTQSVATRNARGLFRLLSIIRKRGAGLFWLPVGWNVARSGIYLSLLRTARISPGLRRNAASFASQLVFTPVGMVSHLLPIRRSEVAERRPRVAEFHGNG